MKLVRKNPAPSSSALPPRPRPAANREAPRRVVAPRSQPSAKPLPRPRRAGAGKGLVAAALLAMLAVAAAGYWVHPDAGQLHSAGISCDPVLAGYSAHCCRCRDSGLCDSRAACTGFQQEECRRKRLMTEVQRGWRTVNYGSDVSGVSAPLLRPYCCRPTAIPYRLSGPRP